MVLFLAAAVVLSDQLIKIAVVQFLKPVGSVTAIPGLLDLVYVENTGAAFGLFADQRWVFIALTIIFVIVLIAVLFRLKITSKIYFTAMFLILGGAVGNLIDRIFNGFVVDYLQLSFFPPVCNLADYCVVIGVVLMLIYVLFFTDFSLFSIQSEDDSLLSASYFAQNHIVSCYGVCNINSNNYIKPKYSYGEHCLSLK